MRLYPNKKKVPAKTPNAKLHNMRYSTTYTKAHHDWQLSCNYIIKIATYPSLTGNYNNAFGYYSFTNNTTGQSNVAVGYRVLHSN